MVVRRDDFQNDMEKAAALAQAENYDGLMFISEKLLNPENTFFDDVDSDAADFDDVYPDVADFIDCVVNKLCLKHDTDDVSLRSKVSRFLELLNDFEREKELEIESNSLAKIFAAHARLAKHVLECGTENEYTVRREYQYALEHSLWESNKYIEKRPLDVLPYYQKINILAMFFGTEQEEAEKLLDKIKLIAASDVDMELYAMAKQCVEEGVYFLTTFPQNT